MSDKTDPIIIGSDWYEPVELYRQFKDRAPITLSAESRDKVRTCHTFLTDKISDDKEAYYGINTGFGSLCDVRIKSSELEMLQYNLLRSHACGTGETIPREIVRLILLLKVMSLSQGHSGVSVDLIERLAEFYNEGILPVIYEYGSLGASGDLAPLAHLALPLINEGEVWKDDAIVATGTLGLNALKLGPKSGLALINGTQFSTAFAYWCVMESRRLMTWTSLITALSCDVFGCLRMPFDARIHAVRKQTGQQKVAQDILSHLKDSPLERISGQAVQDPYSFRCAPQVLGATRDAMAHVMDIIDKEINAVTDNPNIFSDTDGILTGGNFHAQPIALISDYLAIAMAEAGSIAERRIYQLLNGDRGLPAYLTNNPGYESGFMIVQYSAASIVSHNKQLCTPSSVDSIVSSQGQEDHVSMAANAASKLYKVVNNVERILAMELMTAMQALDFRRPEKTSPTLEAIYEAYRKEVPFADHDREMYISIRKSESFIKKDPDHYMS